MRHRPLVLTAAFFFSLAIPLGFADRSTADDPKSKSDTPKPPAGWKEHSPVDGTYFVWMPDKGSKPAERSGTRITKGFQVKFNTLSVVYSGGPSYIAEEAILPPAMARKLSHTELEEAFRDETASVLGGKVTDEADVKAGDVPGKEYRIEGKTNGRARVFVTPNNSHVFLLRVTGTKFVLDGENAKTFLESGRLAAPKSKEALEAAAKRGPKTAGNAFDPEFKDDAPAGGLLVGLEVSYGKFGDNFTVRTARPIYRVGEKTSKGTQYGAPGTVVKAVAKPGYAVGGMTVRGALIVDGFSLTFMKVTSDGTLDPKDHYESDWIGGKGGFDPVNIGGDGTPVIGLLGRANAKSKDVTALGLVYKE